jgi:hypothetical protein
LGLTKEETEESGDLKFKGDEAYEDLGCGTSSDQQMISVRLTVTEEMESAEPKIYVRRAGELRYLSMEDLDTAGGEKNARSDEQLKSFEYTLKERI